jgi:hypothetical protein
MTGFNALVELMQVYTNIYDTRGILYFQNVRGNYNQ